MNSRISPETILYLLAYAFQLDWDYFKNSARSENLEDLSFFDLLCFALSKWTNLLLKRGLNKSFLINQDEISKIRGKILFEESFKKNRRKKTSLFCEYDEISYNIIENRILLSTVAMCEKTLKHKYKEGNYRKQEDLNALIQNYINIHHRFKYEIIPIRLAQNLFASIQYNRLNMHYKDIITLCYFIYLSSIVHQSGTNKFLDIPDGYLSKIFERFLRNYLIEHFAEKGFIVSNPPSHDWLVDLTGEKTKYMPSIQPDILISKSKKPKMVIDAKFYGSPVYRVTRYDNQNILSKEPKDTIYKTYSGNIYQIMAYSNYYNCNGLLVYAQTESGAFYERAQLNRRYYSKPVDNLKIGFYTLDMTGDLESFKRRLQSLISEFIIPDLNDIREI